MKKSSSVELEIDGPILKAEALKLIQDLFDVEEPGDLIDSTSRVKVTHNKLSVSAPPTKASLKKKKA